MLQPTAKDNHDIRDGDYQKSVADALDATVNRINAGTGGALRSIDLATDRMIIFSDQHKGASNGADDFRHAQRAYNAALAYYHSREYTLVELGDVEELWEERPAAVLKAYDHTIRLSAEFHRAGRYIRIWGNHDDHWRYEGRVKDLLWPIFGNDPNGAPLSVYEGVRLDLKVSGVPLGSIVLVHGHQGTLTSDKYGRISRFFVRWVWRPYQRLTNTSLNTPARDWKLREKHNIALYKWARAQTNTVLVAGHTHRPVMRSRSHAMLIEDEIAQLERLSANAGEDNTRLAELKAELEWSRAQESGRKGAEGVISSDAMMDRSCYFNTGCCCYSDGDITGLELVGDEIRLVRWPDNQDRPLPHVLATCSLSEVFREELVPV